MGPTPGLMPLIAGATGGLKFGRTGATRGATTTPGARLMTFTPFGWPKTMIPPGGLLLTKLPGRRSSVDEIAGPGSTADEVAARARGDEVAGPGRVPTKLPAPGRVLTVLFPPPGRSIVLLPRMVIVFPSGDRVTMMFAPPGLLTRTPEVAPSRGR